LTEATENGRPYRGRLPRATLFIAVDQAFVDGIQTRAGKVVVLEQSSELLFVERHRRRLVGAGLVHSRHEPWTEFGQGRRRQSLQQPNLPFGETSAVGSLDLARHISVLLVR
jgi:hypothetical protein